MARKRRRVEQVVFPADGRIHRHDDLFADAIDRRVRDLGEELLEIVVKQCGRSERTARAASLPIEPIASLPSLAIGAIGKCAGLRRNSRTPAGATARWRGLAREGRVLPANLQGKRNFRPAIVVGLLGGDLGLDLVVGDDAPFMEIDEEHLPGLQPSLVQDVFRRNIQHADFGRHDDQAVLGDIVAQRPQPVAIEDGANAGCRR